MSLSTSALRHRHGSTVEAIAEALREAILAGAMKPGASLRQEELAARFGVSRIPVRDALRLLEGEGLVTIVPNRGAFVTVLSGSEVAEIFHLRLLLECDCLTAALPRMDAAALDAIDRALRRAEIEAETLDWAAGDWRFHEALYRPSSRSRQIAMIAALRTTSDLYAAAHDALPDSTARWLADHRAILAACRAGDGDAAIAALRQHLQDTADFVAARMGAR
jgi:DNA-binding GntR family transcriptional regulator